MAMVFQLLTQIIWQMANLVRDFDDFRDNRITISIVGMKHKAQGRQDEDEETDPKQRKVDRSITRQDKMSMNKTTETKEKYELELVKTTCLKYSSAK